MRIVSLLPSATEIICEIGLGGQLVGVTHECDYPPVVRGLPKVTRTLIPTDATSKHIDGLVRERVTERRALYTLDMPVLERLKPDLIVTQALCDVCAVAENEVSAAACVLPGQPPVINLEPTRLAEVLNSIRAVGQAAGADEAARAAVARLNGRIDAVTRCTRRLKPVTVVLLEWIDPLFSCGHWSPEVVRLAGGTELIGREGERSRIMRWQEVVEIDPEVLFIACCGFDIRRTLQDMPILEAHPGYYDLACVRARRVYVTDGNAYFSRPGPRLVDSLELMAHALHPEHIALPANQLHRVHQHAVSFRA